MNPYTLLGVLPGASKSEIQSAFNQKIRSFPGDDPLSQPFQNAIGEAYQHLMKKANTIYIRPQLDDVMEKYRTEKQAFPQILIEAKKMLNERKEVNYEYFQQILNLTLTTARKLIDELEKLDLIGPENGKGMRNVS